MLFDSSFFCGFLAPGLGQAACRLENAITDEIVKLLEKALGHPKTCPHGNPIPTMCGGIIEEIHGHPCSDLITSERYEVAGKIAREVQQIVPQIRSPMRERLHTLTTHKILGYPMMAIALLSTFYSIFTFGDYTSGLLSGLFYGWEPFLRAY